jgi:hypothetical protein
VISFLGREAKDYSICDFFPWRRSKLSDEIYLNFRILYLVFKYFPFIICIPISNMHYK